jgi:hypothetical protein
LLPLKKYLPVDKIFLIESNFQKFLETFEEEALDDLEAVYTNRLEAIKKKKTASRIGERFGRLGNEQQKRILDLIQESERPLKREKIDRSNLPEEMNEIELGE